MNSHFSLHLGLSAFLLFATLPLRAQFEDQSAGAGINNTGRNRGIAIVDFDRDGWEDLYFTRLDGPNVLYRNLGDGTFIDVASTAGVDYAGASGTAVWGDLDNDGRPDLVLGNRREMSRIYRNLGDGTFSDITFSAGVAVNAQVMSVNLADVDRDGWLDIYFANLGEENALYRNNGDGTFSDWTYYSGALDRGVAMGAVFFDYDNDGDPDLYLTHDADQPNILYQNNGDGTFTDVSRASGLDLAAQGMGVDVADIDLDGWLDVYITNLYENILFRNRGDGTFENIAAAAGVTDRGMGWGTVFLDYNNDGFPDIYVANETKFAVDYRYFDNILYRNLGNLRFQADTTEYALRSPYGGYGVAAADLDKNGQVDLVIANSGSDGNQLLLNRRADGHHWLQLRLEGTVSNRSAVGARVILESAGRILTDEVIAGSGFAGQNSLYLHFGLGNSESVDRLRILWPSGLEEVYEGLTADQSLLFTERVGLTNTRLPIHETSLPIEVWPNPVSGPFAIRFSLPAPVPRLHLRLYDTSGRLLLKEWDDLPASGEVRRQLQLPEETPPGLYHLRIMAGRHTYAATVFLLSK